MRVLIVPHDDVRIHGGKGERREKISPTRRPPPFDENRHGKKERVQISRRLMVTRHANELQLRRFCRMSPPFFLECEDSRRYEATLSLGEKFLLFAPTGSELAREINRGRNRREEEEERLKFHRDRVMRAPIK